MEIDKLEIEVSELGRITIHSELSKERNDLIGTLTHQYAKSPVHYYADIIKNEDGTFLIKDLKVVKPESIDVGWHRKSGQYSSSVTIITNRDVGKDITVYPKGVISVIYK
jgi:hypothetical protein